MSSETQENQMTFRRLLLAKKLFQHGFEHSYKSGDLNKIIAVHNFHNAIEITLKCIVLHYEIRPEKEVNIDFESLLNQVDNHAFFKEKGQKLPYRQNIRNLNQLRNLVQHHAVEPESSTLEDWRVFTRKFLEGVFKEYFNYDIDEISSISLISDERLRLLMHMSCIRLSKKQWHESVFISDVVFDWGKTSIYKYLPNEGKNRKPHVSSRTKDSSYNEHIDTIYNRVKDVESFAAMLFSGINITDYKRFESHRVPYCFMSDGSYRWNRKNEITDEHAKWVHEFVINSIVTWQLSGLGPAVPELAEKCFQYIMDEEEAGAGATID